MDTAAKLDQALDYLNDSRANLKQGKVVVLEGFQNEVRKICVHIGGLEQDEMRKYAGKLEELSASLKILEQELRDQQTSVQQDIFKLNRKQKALQSYQTVNHSHKDEE